VIRLDFDLSHMSQMPVGPAWSGLSDDQKKQVSDAFGRCMTAAYADHFDSYSGEKLEVTGQRPPPTARSYTTASSSRMANRTA
jgi:phospholipid transport system substrate-binding protein